MLIQLALTGLLAALLPAWVVLRSSGKDKYRKLVTVTLVLTFELIMFGAFTRLTDSGLGCPDWPGCYGEANPFQAHADIHAAATAMPSGPVTHMKAWIEMIHRYLAMGIGVLLIAVMAFAWRQWIRSDREEQKYSPWLPSILLAFVCVQGAFGAWTVTMKLQPIIVTIHLLLGMSLLAMLAWLNAHLSNHQHVSHEALRLRMPALFAAAILFVQIALGGWVSTNYAALACMDFPLCHGKLIPEMDFANGFSLWRELGKTSGGEYLQYPSLTAIHWAHRCFAFFAACAIGWVGFRALGIGGLRSAGRWLLIALAVQIATGVSTIFLEWPLALAVLHNGGAALLVLVLVMVNYKARIPAAAPPHLSAASLSSV
ncbi:COX15/CtaA family protein [soil metagenome]